MEECLDQTLANLGTDYLDRAPVPVYVTVGVVTPFSASSVPRPLASSNESKWEPPSVPDAPKWESRRRRIKGSERYLEGYGSIGQDG